MVGVVGVEVGLVATVRVPGVPQMPVVFIVGRPVAIEKVYLIIAHAIRFVLSTP